MCAAGGPKAQWSPSGLIAVYRFRPCRRQKDGGGYQKEVRTGGLAEQGYSISGNLHVGTNPNRAGASLTDEHCQRCRHQRSEEGREGGGDQYQQSGLE